MGREPKNETLNDAWGDPHEYVFLHIAGRKGLRLQHKLIRILTGAGGLAALAADAGGAGAMESAGRAVGDAFGAIVDRIMDAGSDALFLELLETTSRDGKMMSGAVFDSAYAGNYGEMYSALWHALDHNFRSTFSLGNLLSGELGEALSAIMAQIKSQSGDVLLSFSQMLKSEALSGSSGSAQEATTPVD